MRTPARRPAIPAVHLNQPRFISRTGGALADPDDTDLTGLGEGWYRITSGDRRVGFGLRWDPGVFRHLWFWHVFGGMPGYPWYGLSYNCALEPWTSYPDGGLTRAIENGSALAVGPRATIETRLVAVAYSGVTRIAGIDADGEIRNGA